MPLRLYRWQGIREVLLLPTEQWGRVVGINALKSGQPGYDYFVRRAHADWILRERGLPPFPSFPRCYSRFKRFRFYASGFEVCFTFVAEGLVSVALVYESGESFRRCSDAMKCASLSSCEKWEKKMHYWCYSTKFYLSNDARLNKIASHLADNSSHIL